MSGNRSDAAARCLSGSLPQTEKPSLLYVGDHKSVSVGLLHPIKKNRTGLCVSRTEVTRETVEMTHCLGYDKKKTKSRTDLIKKIVLVKIQICYTLTIRKRTQEEEKP